LIHRLIGFKGIVGVIVIVEIDEIGVCPPLTTLRAVSSVVSWLSTLETGYVCVSAGGSSGCGICMGWSLVASLSPIWSMCSIQVHQNWLIVHPSQGIGRVVALSISSLRTESWSLLLEEPSWVPVKAY